MAADIQRQAMKQKMLAAMLGHEAAREHSAQALQDSRHESAPRGFGHLEPTMSSLLSWRHCSNVCDAG
jgi:hypothetical protein